MAIAGRNLGYRLGDTTFEAYVAWDDAASKPRPGVLVAHAWRGRSDFEDAKAERLAGLGYVGFALDVYGKGVLGSNPEQNQALMQPLLDDRALLQRRLQLALEQLRLLPEVDDTRVAAIGFCFGGLCVLDLVRSGADVNGVASFHGLLGAPGNSVGNRSNARVLVLHGWDDPMATPEQVLALTEEMDALGADWQLHAYGGTMHAFTNPQAADPEHGLQYSPAADLQSWHALEHFLSETFC